MLKLNDTSKRLPFGGHHFRDHEHTFKAGSFTELLKKVEDFRLTNNKPAGNPEQEVLQYYATHFPWMVRNDRERFGIETHSQKYVSWREWLYRTWTNPPVKFLSTKEAESRWEVCEHCPFNEKKDWKKTKESEELDRRAFVLRRGITTPEHLGFCDLHKADLSVFALIEKAKDFSKAPNEEELYCWLFRP